jgi:hypothetical protein
MRILAAAAVLAVGMTSANAAQAAGEFSHEGWTGQAVFDSGKLRQCHMWMSAINNYDLGLALEPSGELRLGIRSQKIDIGWTMIFNQKTALRMQIDDSPVLTKAFTTITPKLLSTSLKDTDWEKRLPAGKLLRINTGKVKLFHLTGIKEALGLLRACVAKQRSA